KALPTESQQTVQGRQRGWRLRELHDWPHLDGAEARTRDLGSDLRGLVDTACLHKVVAPELFLGFGEWAIRVCKFSIPHAHRLCGARRLQRIAALDVLGKLLAESLVFAHLSRVETLAEALFVLVNQQQILHSSFPP